MNNTFFESTNIFDEITESILPDLSVITKELYLIFIKICRTKIYNYMYWKYYSSLQFSNMLCSNLLMHKKTFLYYFHYLMNIHTDDSQISINRINIRNKFIEILDKITKGQLNNKIVNIIITTAIGIFYPNFDKTLVSSDVIHAWCKHNTQFNFNNY